MERAIFGAGCFWGVEAAFAAVDGVTATAAGYAGGTLEHPTYEDVCSHGTGHAEVVEVTYDPERVSFDELLEVFWAEHNPTRRGDQYRSVVFVESEAQLEAARRSRDALQASGRYDDEIVTQIEPAPAFWRAEERHQEYVAKHRVRVC